MNKNIAFYISANGRESVNRCSAILATLLRLEEEIKIYLISHSYVIDLMKRYFSEEKRIHYFIEETDAGAIRLGGTDSIDWECTKKKEAAFVDTWEEKREQAETFLKEKGIGLVVSDLCPWIFPAADNLRIRSVLLADFTWDQVYEGYLEEEICDAYRACYELASKVIAYDLHQQELEEIAEDYQPVSLAAPPYNMELIGEVRMAAQKTLVYIQTREVGDADMDELPYEFINGLDEDGAYYEDSDELSADYYDFMENVHNYIAACDYVIAQPAWDVMAYALLANKKAAYYVDEDMTTEKKRVELVKERGQCIEVGKEDLRDIGAVIEKLKELDYSYETGYHNDDYDIAKIILGFYPKKKQKITGK